MKILDIKSLLWVLILLMPSKILACCIGNWVNVFPTNGKISSNSIFIIEFSVQDYPFSRTNELSQMAFFGRNKENVSYNLDIQEINFVGSFGQILLKSNVNFLLGDSISLTGHYFGLSNKNLETRETFLKFLTFSKWEIIGLLDYTPPLLLLTDTNHVITDYINSSAPSLGIIINVDIEDDSFSQLDSLRYDFPYIPIVYELRVDSQKYILTSNAKSFQIYSGMCGSNFNYSLDKKHLAVVRAMDSSGNYSDSKSFNFTIPKPVSRFN